MHDLRFWRRRRVEDEDIARELQVHLDLAAEERRNGGLSPHDAQLDAHREFGSVALTTESLRAMRTGATLERWVSHAWWDFRYALRLLRRSPTFTIVSTLILALPIAANTVVFSLVNTMMLQQRPGRIDTLVSVLSRDRQQPDSYRDFSYPLYVDLRERADIFESVMAHAVALVGIREGDTTMRAFAEIVSANYFSTLGAPLTAGRAFTLQEERPGANAPVVIASYAAWRRSRFDPGFIGSEVRVNGTPYTIVGVAAKGLRTTSLLAPDWWFPLGTYDRLINEWFRDGGPKELDDRANHTLFLAGALRSGVTRSAAEQALDTLSRRLGDTYPATDRDRAFSLTDVPRLNLGSRPQNEAPLTFAAGLLMLMAVLVLGIACLNLANLMMARGAARRRELGIRQALGGSRGRIIAQLFIEGLSLSMVGAVAGVLLAWWADFALSAWLASVFTFIATGGVDLTIEPSKRMVFVAGGLSIFSAVCFALGPAWRLSRPSVTSDLQDQPGALTRRFGSGSVLVAMQLTMSLALLAVGGLFVRSAVEAANANPGFTIERLLVVSLDPSFGAYDESRTRTLYGTALERVHAIPGVTHASFASKVAFGEFIENGLVGSGEPNGADVAAGYTIVTAEYFDTLRLPILRGRGFTQEENDRVSGVAPAVISEPLARLLFRDGDAIGRHVTLRRGTAQTQGRGNVETREPLTIVGIVPGTTQDIFDRQMQSQIYVPYGARFRAAMVLHVAVGPQLDERSVLASVQRELRRLDEQLPIITARTMTAQRDASIPRWAVRAAAMVFGLFGIVALLIASIGVYGVEAYEVARRTKELGIRLALGASHGDIKRLVLGRGLKTAAFGLSLGLLLALGFGRLVTSMLYRVSPYDPAALVTSLLVLAGVTLVACYIPARRATRIATLETLRTE